MAISKIVQNSLDTDSISLGPKISSVQIANSTYVVKDDTAVNIGGGYIVITGSGFTSNSTVLIGSNSACSVTFVSTTQLRAEVPASAAGSYPVYVVTGDGGTAIRVNALTYSNTPTWVTTSPLTSQSVDFAFSIQLSATGANTYVLQAGSSLPSGVSLAANGLLSGTVTGIENDTTYNFTVEAIDTENQESPKALAITISGQYIVSRSLRFNDADSAYLTRTPASSGNRKTFTFSAWIKYNIDTEYSVLFSALNSGGGDQDALYFDNTTYAQALVVRLDSFAGIALATTQTFRDPSAWYHIVMAMDTTQATAANRLKLYVNGVEITSFQVDGRSSITLNSDMNGWNRNGLHLLGSQAQSAPAYTHRGYMAEVHFVDGTALTPSSFGKFDDKFGGTWIPKTVSGVTYGTNGFYLPFSDNTSTTTLGNDGTANNNDWTLNNFSVAAGSNNDSVVDTPTNTGVDDGSGADVKGNYATFNSLAKAWTAAGNGTLTDGNLRIAHTSGNWYGHKSTLAMTSGKWYFELENVSGTSTVMVGISLTSVGVENGAGVYRWRSNASKESTSGAAYGANWQTAGDIAGVAFDADARTLEFYKNGVSQGVAFSDIPAGDYAAEAVVEGNSTAIINFGQRPFANTAPSGFKTLSSHNLPTGINANTAATLANSYFETLTYTGNGSTQTIGGLNFAPDFVWIKARSIAANHRMYDTIRGATQSLYPDIVDAEGTESTGLTAFTANGFSLGAQAGHNQNSATYVAWCWNAGGANTTNTDGTVTSIVRANQTAGFSVVSYASGSAGQKTVGHGLGKTPSMIITKSRGDGTYNWAVYHRSATDTTSKFLRLNTSDAIVESATIWGAALPTSTVFGITSDGGVPASTNCIAYCWAEIEGFSKFGSYTGNGSADGPFVYLGFRPAFIMIKRTNSGDSWFMYDNKRETFNPNDSYINADTNNTEDTNNNTIPIDFAANGFKNRGTSTGINGNASNYIYMAFAEHPLKYARAK